MGGTYQPRSAHQIFNLMAEIHPLEERAWKLAQEIAWTFIFHGIDPSVGLFSLGS